MARPVKAVLDGTFTGHVKVLIVGASKDDFGNPKFDLEVYQKHRFYEKGHRLYGVSMLFLWSKVSYLGIAGIKYEGKPDVSEFIKELEQ